MRTIIAGSRGITNMAELVTAMSQIDWPVTCVISGHAQGVDRLGEQWAYSNGVPVQLYIAHWNEEGRRAGYLRNERMADNADALVALWDGVSKGTKHMIDIATRKGLRVYVHKVTL